MSQTLVFEQLIDRDLPVLRRAVWHIVHNVADTDEIIQNALLKAWRAFNSFRQESKLSSWLYSIAVNEAYSLIRQRAKERQTLAELPLAENESPVNEPLLKALDEAVARLPSIYREVILLTLIDGISGEQAAKLSGCNLNTFYWRVSKAKSLLRDALKEVNYE